MEINLYYRTAVKHLFTYLDARPGRLLFAYEDGYRPILEVIKAIAANEGRDIDYLAVDHIDLDTLYQCLTNAEKFICAFNRTFGKGLTQKVRIMTERATMRGMVAYTLADLSAVFFDIFQADPHAIRTLNTDLIRAMQAGRNLVVVDNNGTHLEIDLDETYHWVNMDCFTEIDFDLTVNLPVGEVATYSPRVSGEIYFTGALLGTIPIGRKYGLVLEPIYIQIENNQIRKIRTDNSQLQRDLELCLFFDDYTHTVNEIGFGTNFGVPKPFLGFNYKYEENAVGFHLGFGASLAQQNVQRLTPHHLDFVFDQSHVILDGDTIYNGKFYPERFSATFSDEPLRLARRTCCGLCGTFSQDMLEGKNPFVKQPA